MWLRNTDILPAPLLLNRFCATQSLCCIEGLGILFLSSPLAGLNAAIEKVEQQLTQEDAA
jgi:hypothetical protein